MSSQAIPKTPLAALPAELRTALAVIAHGGPFPSKQDGTAIRNREGHLPPQPAGYYREYTVETPGAADRGSRRTVVGPGGEISYTDDHYNSFTEVV